MGFPRQEYWSGLPFPSSGDLPDPGIKPTSPALASRFFTAEPPGKPHISHINNLFSNVYLISYYLEATIVIRGEISFCYSCKQQNDYERNIYFKILTHQLHQDHKISKVIMKNDGCHFYTFSHFPLYLLT